MTIYDEVTAEGNKAIEKHGPQSHPNGTGDVWARLAEVAKGYCNAAAESGELTWMHILSEEFYEALAEDDYEKLRAELIQVMSVARHWIQDLDAKHGVRPSLHLSDAIVVDVPASPADYTPRHIGEHLRWIPGGGGFPSYRVTR